MKKHVANEMILKSQNIRSTRDQKDVVKVDAKK
jgi:hypothetical protein